MNNKIKEFQKKLVKLKLPLALVFSTKLKDPAFFYFSKINPEYALMLISPNFSPKLYCSSLDFEELKVHSRIKPFLQFKKNTLEQIKKLTKTHKIKKMGVNFSYLTVNELKNLKKLFKCKFVDISGELLNLRAIKTNDEIKLYQKASKLTEQIWSRTLAQIKLKKLKTELQVKEFIEQQIKRINSAPSFPTIVASGKNAAIPHHVTNNAKLNGFCIIDFGIRYKGYCTDVTRTIFIGKPTNKEEKFYNLVYETKECAANKINCGEKTANIVKTARKHLGKYDKFFTHGLGHGIGLEIHELPNLKENSKEKFENGMIFTIEPGIYFKNKFGIRIEDDYLFERNKLIQLTKAPKKLVVV
ncbi:aminopeptidase P family protein [Candidatus Woesearchaeota archaeon]|nr:aminopeptidase P family protein [Candidatus Woesearchaeota archaeon]